MKKISLLIITLLAGFCALGQVGQKTYSTTTPTSTNSLPSVNYRYSAITPDSLNQLWIYNPLTSRYNRFYSATEANKLFAPLVGGGYVPTSRTLTINGVTQDLSANRTWTINTTPTQASLTGNNRIALWNSNDSLTVLPQSYFNYNLSGNYFQSFAEWNLLGTTNMGNTHFLLAPSSGDNPIRVQDSTLYVTNGKLISGAVTINNKTLGRNTTIVRTYATASAGQSNDALFLNSSGQPIAAGGVTYSGTTGLTYAYDIRTPTAPTANDMPLRWQDVIRPTQLTNAILNQNTPQFGANFYIDGYGQSGSGFAVGNTSSTARGFNVNRAITTINGHSFEETSTLTPVVNNLGYGVFDLTTAMSGSASSDHIIGYQSRQNYTASGNLGMLNSISTVGSNSGMFGYFTSMSHNGTGVINNAASALFNDVAGTGPINNNYGIYIRPITRGTTINEAIHIDEGGIVVNSSSSKAPFEIKKAGVTKLVTDVDGNILVNSLLANGVMAYTSDLSVSYGVRSVPDVAWVDNHYYSKTGGALSGDVTISKASPDLIFNSPSGGTNEKNWDFIANSTVFQGRAINDANNAANNWIEVKKTGFVPDSVTLNERLIVNGTAAGNDAVNATDYVTKRQVAIPTEGTFTFTATQALSQNSGYYTKIGNMVYIRGNVSVMPNAGSGTFILSGLPFTNSALSYGSVNFSYQSIQVTTPTGQIDPSTSTIKLYNGVNLITDANMSGSAIYFTATYNTTN